MGLKRRDDWKVRKVEDPKSAKDLILPGTQPTDTPLPNNAVNHTKRITLNEDSPPSDDFVPCSLLSLIHI